MPEKVYKRFSSTEPEPEPEPELSSNELQKVDHDQSNNSGITQKSRQKPHFTSFNAKPNPATKFKAEAERLLHGRKKLPIWKHRDDLLRCLRQKGSDVLIIVGETGSGKSTQIPQFLLDEPWCKRSEVSIDNQTIKVGGSVVVTQPRRVAAISLARRVAQEFGTPLGNASPASKVGYSVRFDNCTSPSTVIKYETEGTLLQEMLSDPWLRQYSAIVIDEVHERSVNVDLLLGFIKIMMEQDFVGRGGVPLKIIIMSATAEVDILQDYFMPKELEDTTDVNHGSSSPVTLYSIEGRQFPVETICTKTAVTDVLGASSKMIFEINKKEPLPGDVLVFLYGQEAIESVEKLVAEEMKQLEPGVPRLLILPLYAALSQDAQRSVFYPAPHGTRKIILATNIAETSVTIPGVRFVVDCGKFKMKQFRNDLGLETLLVKPISKSSALQRTGRAGREAAGKCWRLYTEEAYKELLPDNTPPEILRCDLAHAILNIKSRGVRDIWKFPFLDRPSREALQEALMLLSFVGAITGDGEVTKIGHRIAKLPLSIPLARTLIAAMDDADDILPEIVDIVSSLSVQNIFLNLSGEEAREKAEEARRSLYRREGDHFTLLKTVQGYAAENADRRDWCRKHFVNHQAMRAVMDTRKQLRRQVSTSNSYKFTDEIQSLSTERMETILKCFLKGFGRNTARLHPDGSYKTKEFDLVVAIHPSSVLHGRKVEVIMYTEYVFTTKGYARGVSVVQDDWVEDRFRDWLQRTNA